MDSFISHLTSMPGGTDIGVLLVGSHTKLHPQVRPVDKDYVLVTQEGGINDLIQHVQWTSWFCEVSDDSWRLIHESQEYGLCLLTTLQFQSRIRAALSDNFVQKDWAIGLVTPEWFCGDVERGIVERDLPDKTLSTAKVSLASEKPAMIRVLKEQTIIKLKALQSLLKKNPDGIKSEVLKWELLFFLVRLHYLMNNEFCKGIKHYPKDAPTLSLGIEMQELIDKIMQDPAEMYDNLSTFIFQHGC